MTAAGPPSARPRRKAPRAVPGVAEDVLAGHPDRLADALAEAVVDSVLAADGEAAVGVEVAWHRDLVLVTGEIAAGDNGPPFLDLKALAARVAHDAGYRWTDRLGVLADLSVTPLTPDDRVARHFSCDQAITVGHASGSAATRWLPPATFAARRLRQALTAVVAEHQDRLGPDGKVLVHLETSGDRHRWRRIGVSVQHAPGAGAEDLHRLVLPALAAAAASLDAALPGLGRLDPALVCLNGAGDFSVGGPQADGGLSGKKLVVDHYGPGVPIGGGALCGKDPYKPDRAGALRARQLAVRLVRDTGAGEATVTLGWLPGAEGPDIVAATVDGVWWDADDIACAVTVPDLTLAGTVRELALTEVNWAGTLRQGYFGQDRRWER